MENRSEHYGDIKLWVEKVINSCETMGQIKTAERLINNFNKQLLFTHSLHPTNVLL